MQGIVFIGERKLELQHFDDPTPGPGEVVLEIKASGMCGSDLKFYRSPPGVMMKALGFKAGATVIAGHEPCGVVVAIGANVNPKQARIGQRVMVHHYRGCGACPHCSTGWMQMCVEGVAEVYGVTGHGAHAKYMKCPATTLVGLPDELSFETGAAIACGTGTAWGALQRLELTGDQTIAIFGQGPSACRPRNSPVRWVRASSRSISAPTGWRAPKPSAPPMSSTRWKPTRSPRFAN